MYNKFNKKVLFLILLLLIAAVYAKGKKDAAPGVSDARFDKLRKGINVFNWFCHPRGPFDKFFTAEDVKLLKDLGMGHIRLVISPKFLYNPSEPTVIKAENLARVDAGLDMLLANDMAVIVDMHGFGLGGQELINDHMKFAAFWEVLAKHLSVRDPGMVFLEVLNEPPAEIGFQWVDIQKKLIEAMRKGAPGHTLIATVHDWSSIDNLVLLKPLKDPNIVYNFHYYEPFEFTHQGATWGAEVWKYYFEVPYPPTKELIEESLKYTQNKEARRKLKFYVQQKWNAERIEKHIARAAKWAKKRNVRIICNEFGTARDRARPSYRNEWIKDVRTACEKYDIGWAMWDYTSGFGMMQMIGGNNRKLDVGTAKALGLNTENVDEKYYMTEEDWAYIFSDDFEPKIMGTWSRAWKEKGCSINNIEADFSKKGKNCLKAEDTGSEGNIARLVKGFNKKTLSCRFYVYFPKSFIDDMVSKGGNRALAEVNYMDGPNDARIQVNSKKFACVYTGQPAAESSVDLQAEKWYCVEFQPPEQTGSGDVAMKWWIDGEEQPSVSFPSGPIGFYKEIYLGLCDNYGTDFKHAAYFDELEIRSNYVGPLK